MKTLVCLAFLCSPSQRPFSTKTFKKLWDFVGKRKNLSALLVASAVSPESLCILDLIASILDFGRSD